MYSVKLMLIKIGKMITLSLVIILVLPSLCWDVCVLDSWCHWGELTLLITNISQTLIFVTHFSKWIQLILSICLEMSCMFAEKTCIYRHINYISVSVLGASSDHPNDSAWLPTCPRTEKKGMWNPTFTGTVTAEFGHISFCHTWSN
jgi:hypothetical protein